MEKSLQDLEQELSNLKDKHWELDSTDIDKIKELESKINLLKINNNHEDPSQIIDF